MAQYKARSGDSPTRIARAFGVPFNSLISANPHKPTTVVAGKRTWKSLANGETVNVPGNGMVGDSASDAINALISAGGPCLQANVALVCAAQRAMGITADGKWGTGSSTAARARVSNAPAGCSPRPAWWTPAGQSNCSSVAPVVASPGGVASLAVQALLTIDPCSQSSVAVVCAAQAALGITVDGKYGSGTAAAARARGVNAPAPCNPAPAWWAPKGQSNCGGFSPPPAPTTGPIVTPVSTSSVSSAVQALVGINPCLQANSGIVYAAQVALGIVADGKYGAGTAAAARALGISAPAACSPAPAWWGAKGTPQATAATQGAKTAAGGSTTVEAKMPASWTAQAAAAAAAAQAADAAAKAAAAATQAQADQAAADAKAAVDAAARAAAQATTQAQADAAAAAAKTAQAAVDAAAAKGGTPPTTGAIVDTKKLSTGAIVVGAVGAAALVGLVAYAVTSKKTGHRGARGPRGRRASKKPAKRAKQKAKR